MELQSGIFSLAPNWTGVFQKWDTLKRFQKEAIVTDIGYFNKNPVCEAHSWDCSYFNKQSDKYCPECSWFSWSWSYVITGDLTLDRPILELKGDQFVEHCNQIHNGHEVKSPEAHRKALESETASSLPSHKRVRRVKGR